MAAETRVWLITGTSSGVGLATTQEVLAAGERVAAVTRKASSLASLVAAYPPENLIVLEFDVGNPNAAVKPLFESVLAHFGRVDVVVNNAGYGLNGVVEGTTDEQAREQMEVNFWGPVRISREAVRVFRENNIGGRILNISSIGGFISNPTLAFYSASKFALEGFSEGLHKELDPTWNIKVITIQLGGARTEWGKSNFRELPLPPAYEGPEGIPNRIRHLIKGNTPVSDPIKVGRALITISRKDNPPLRLPLGPEARYLLHGKIVDIEKDMDIWKDLTLSTAADDADPYYFEKLGVVRGER